MSISTTQGEGPEPSGFMKQPNNMVRDLTEPGWREREAERDKVFLALMAPASMHGGISRLIDNAREFSEGGDRYTGPEVRLWIYELCDEIERLYDADASLTKAYAEGRKDERADNVKAIEALATAIRLGLA